MFFCQLKSRKLSATSQLSPFLFLTNFFYQRTFSIKKKPTTIRSSDYVDFIKQFLKPLQKFIEFTIPYITTATLEIYIETVINYPLFPLEMHCSLIIFSWCCWLAFYKQRIHRIETSKSIWITSMKSQFFFYFIFLHQYELFGNICKIYL